MAHKKDIAYLLNRISKEDLAEYYSMHSRAKCAEHFKVLDNEIRYLISFYNIVKTPQQIKDTTKATCLDRYGGVAPSCSKDVSSKMVEHTDYKARTESMKSTCFEKYGVDSFSKTNEFREIAKHIYDDEEKKENAQIKRKQTCLEKYNAEHPSQVDEVKNRYKETCMEKYGVEYALQSDEIRQKGIETCIEKYGESSYSKTEEFKEIARHIYDDEEKKKRSVEKAKHTNLERYGEESYSKTDEFKRYMKDYSLNKFGVESYSQTEEFLEKFKATCNEHLGVDFPAQSREVHAKASENRKRSCVSSDGKVLDSTWELQIYEFCKRNDIPIEDGPTIEYTYDNKKHCTLIDFKIDGYLVEVKGDHLLNGCFDYEGVPIDIKLDLYRKNNIIVITNNRSIFGRPNSTESNGLRYQNKCPNPLIGVDIELFRNPEFPYASDRPKCFYNVRVDGKKSALEAWSDEKLRWEMIKNRIEYSGGFIDSKQILNAMNITRNCKQPSWFSKSFAKNIIKKYCTSDIIVDPFAGWGARYDAAIELNKKYIGSDFNEELVQWHKSLNRDIEYADANNFKYDGECSVFICPPYSDKNGRCFEDYNFDGFDTSAKSLTQCEWLSIVMKNVPNANEYVMVCKVVDLGWEKYVVEEKINKSHFGNNSEYVLVIENN